MPPAIEPAEPRTQVRWLNIEADQAGQRLDNYLKARLKGLPKSRIYSLLRKGEVRVNKGRVKPDYRLCTGDLVRLPPMRLSRQAPLSKPSDRLCGQLRRAVLFENDGLLVLNKPPGLAVHGGSGVSLGLIEVLRQMRPEARFLELIHRLDRDTSGCIMVAKKRSMLRHMQAALRAKAAGGVVKIYQALVLGSWTRRRRTVAEPLLRLDIKGDRIVKVHPEGKPSVTHFRLLKDFGEVSWVEARLETGRTHQIRVHAQVCGHSLVGDEKYGQDRANEQWRQKGAKRLFLHASKLGFVLPGETDTTWVEAPLPHDLTRVLDNLRPSGCV